MTTPPRPGDASAGPRRRRSRARRHGPSDTGVDRDPIRYLTTMWALALRRLRDHVHTPTEDD